jgi:hypothetical protein
MTTAKRYQHTRLHLMAIAATTTGADHDPV